MSQGVTTTQEKTFKVGKSMRYELELCYARSQECHGLMPV